MKRERVRCDRCGYLALKQLGGERLAEVDLERRNRDSVPYWEDKGGNQYAPVCFVQASDLTDEISKSVKMVTSYAEARVRVIHRSRQCREFYKYRQGSTPKEHTEMFDRKEWRRWHAEENRKNRYWRIYEALILFAMACVFLLLGYFLSN